MAVFPVSQPVFRPAMEVITAITTQPYFDIQQYFVTTGQDNDYKVGLVLRFNIPESFGMQSINGQTLRIHDIISADSFTVLQANDFGFVDDPFAIPVGALQSAQCIPVAETDLDINQQPGFQLNQAVQNVLPRGTLP